MARSLLSSVSHWGVGPSDYSSLQNLLPTESVITFPIFPSIFVDTNPSKNGHSHLILSAPPSFPSLPHAASTRLAAAVSTSSLPSRRQSLLLLLSLPAPFLALTSPSRAADIGLFGIRKRDLVKLEQEAVEVVKEGEEAVEKELKTAEKEIESAAAAVAAEAGGAGVGVQIAGDLVQAGAVAGAEAVGVLVGLSVVNGILRTETQK